MRGARVDPDRDAAAQAALDRLRSMGADGSFHVDAVGHRIVHGGDPRVSVDRDAGVPGRRAAQGAAPPATGGVLAFTFGSWFTWTAVGVAFPALGVCLITVSDLLAQGAYEAFPAFATTHIATLGWATMTIMGAAMQMAPALLGARVRAERTIPWLYVLFAGSVLVLVAGFAAGRPAWAAAGGAGIDLAAWWFLALLAAAVASAGVRRTVLSPHIPVALLCFLLVLLWGVLLAADLRWGIWPGLFVGHRGLLVHLSLGLGGFLGLMVVGVFYRLVPLVHGARVASMRRGWSILLLGVLAIAGVLAGVASGAGPLFQAAACSAAGALMFFTWEILHVLAHRRGRAPDLNVAHWQAVAAYSVALAALGTGWAAGLLRTASPDRLGECAAVVFLLGWVTQAIIGQLYKITPFLMWYYRATIPDVLAIPRQPAPYQPRLGRLVLWGSNAGVVLLAGGIWLGAAPLARAGAVLFAGAALVLAYLLAYRWVPPVIAKRLPFEWRWRIS